MKLHLTTIKRIVFRISYIFRMCELVGWNLKISKNRVVVFLCVLFVFLRERTSQQVNEWVWRWIDTLKTGKRRRNINAHFRANIQQWARERIDSRVKKRGEDAREMHMARFNRGQCFQLHEKPIKNTLDKFKTSFSSTFHRHSCFMRSFLYEMKQKETFSFLFASIQPGKLKTNDIS